MWELVISGRASCGHPKHGHFHITVIVSRLFAVPQLKQALLRKTLCDLSTTFSVPCVWDLDVTRSRLSHCKLEIQFRQWNAQQKPSQDIPGIFRNMDLARPMVNTTKETNCYYVSATRIVSEEMSSGHDPFVTPIPRQMSRPLPIVYQCRSAKLQWPEICDCRRSKRKSKSSFQFWKFRASPSFRRKRL